MITIIQEPAQVLDAAFFRREFIVQMQAGYYTTRQASVLIEIEVNGTLYNPKVYAQPYIQTGSVGTFTAWIFKISPWRMIWSYAKADRQARLFLDSSSAVSYRGGAYLVRFKLTELLPPSTGTGSPTLGSSAWTQYTSYLDAAPDPMDLPDLHDFTIAWNNPVRWLTNKPSGTITSLRSRESLAIWSDQILSVRVTAYDETGAIQTQGLLAIKPGAVSSSQEAVVIGIGPAQINEIDPGEWIGGTVTIETSTAWYEVVGGWGCVDGTIIPLTEVRRYYVSPCQHFEAEIYFLNPFGFWDYIGVEPTVEISAETQGNLASFQSDNPAESYEGRTNYSTTSKELSVELKSLPDAERKWINEDLPGTSLCKATKPGGTYSDGLFNARVKTTKTIPRTSTKRAGVEITLEYTWRKISQQG